jgi:hypothetical protein
MSLLVESREQKEGRVMSVRRRPALLVRLMSLLAISSDDAAGRRIDLRAENRGRLPATPWRRRSRWRRGPRVLDGRNPVQRRACLRYAPKW